MHPVPARRLATEVDPGDSVKSQDVV